MEFTKEQKEMINKLIANAYDNLFNLQMIYFDDDIIFHLVTDVILKLNVFMEEIKNEI